jgi:hypothetical protein
MAREEAFASNRAIVDRWCGTGRRVSRAWLLALAVLAAPCAAQTAVKGIVTDRTTTLPLAGASVELRRGADVVGRTVSRPDGSFLIVVDAGQAPQAQNFKLAVAHDGFVAADQDVVITSARPDSTLYKSVLVRKAVADCVLKRARRVVVGHFRPPSGAAGATEFAARVTDALLYQLSFMERSRVAADRRPSVVACERLDDRENLPALARELNADALMSGSVARPDARPRYSVTMFLGDPYGLFDNASRVHSRDVDLDDPSASRLAPEALAAVLEALLTGYVKNGQFAECVELSGLALSELPKPSPAAIVNLRAECLRRQPARGLLGGTP